MEMWRERMNRRNKVRKNGGEGEGRAWLVGGGERGEEVFVLATSFLPPRPQPHLNNRPVLRALFLSPSHPLISSSYLPTPSTFLPSLPTPRRLPHLLLSCLFFLFLFYLHLCFLCILIFLSMRISTHFLIPPFHPLLDTLPPLPFLPPSYPSFLPVASNSAVRNVGSFPFSHCI